MSNDLEKFLQQAAERLAQKSGSQRPIQSKRPTPANRPDAQRRVASPPTVSDEIVEARPVSERRLREMGPDPLSTIDTRPALAQVIDQSDERMGDHVHQVFDHQLSQMRPSSGALQQVGRDPLDVASTNKQSSSTTLVKMLRNPETLRAAFIAGEIFNRRNW
ncbi:MAG: hypothetical protein U0892_21800 [Pirellulales bacterium]